MKKQVKDYPIIIKRSSAQMAGKMFGSEEVETGGTDRDSVGKIQADLRNLDHIIRKIMKNRH